MKRVQEEIMEEGKRGRKLEYPVISKDVSEEWEDEKGKNKDNLTSKENLEQPKEQKASMEST